MTRTETTHAGRWWILLAPVALAGLALGLLGDGDYAEDAWAETRPLTREATPKRRAGLDLNAPIIALDGSAPASTEHETRQGDVPASTHATALRGSVLDEYGHPVSEARVQLSHLSEGLEGGLRQVDQITTDDTGHFEFAAVPSGRLHVYADAPGCGPAWVNAVGAGTWVELRLSAIARLEVVVRDDEGAFAVAARVVVHREGFEREERTDTEGSACFEDLPAGMAGIRVRTKGGASAARLVRLDEEVRTRVDVTLSPPRTVRGRVVEYGTGRPIAEAQVRIEAAGSQRVEGRADTTTDDGTFALTVAHHSAQGATVRVLRSGYAEGRAHLGTSADPGDLEITLWPERLIDGRVIDARGRPVASAHVTWAAASTADADVVSDTRGHFRVPLPPAPTDGSVHALVATTRDGGYGATAVRFNASDERVVLILRAPGTVTGRVLDPAGRPVASARVELVASPAHVPGLKGDADEAWARQRGLDSCLPGLRAHGEAHTVSVTDSAGRYQLARVPAGAWSQRIVHGSLAVQIRRQALVGEGAVVVLDLMAPAAEALFGRVVDEDGHGIPGARVLARAPGGGNGTSTTSGVDGRYRLPALRSDQRFDLIVSSAGRSTVRREAVAPGTRPLVLRLPKARPTQP